MPVASVARRLNAPSPDGTIETRSVEAPGRSSRTPSNENGSARRSGAIAAWKAASKSAGCTP